MTTPTMADLLTARTKDEFAARLLDRLKTKGCPVTDWESGGIERTLVEIEAQENSDFSAQQVMLAQSAFLSTAAESWVDIVAAEVYHLTRYPATYTYGALRLDCLGSVGPYTILPGQLWFKDVYTGNRFTNTTGGILLPGGTLSITVRGESAGADYNALIGTITSMLTPLTGVTCTNLDNGSGSWPATPGTNRESTPLLVQRCQDRWATLGYGQNKDWYRYYARNDHQYANQVTRVLVSTDPFLAGTVNVVIAGDSGPLSSDVVNAVQASLRAKVGEPITVNVYSATALAAAIVGIAYVRAGFDTTYLAAAQAAMLALVRSLDIGESLFVSAITEQMMSPPGVVNWVAIPPTAEMNPSPTQIVTLNPPVASSIVIV